ncbi:efflux RND transporter periplasmic adaptor subunit [Algoriphagus sediminis]|uniref:Efflux RND transporter periplasmic adaptor subunit n=1 Tax=Algoriphagus sediminis TaxID=3057113 RepID=A0ABT7YD12_9BACT|nr:efflux RND transporter periplasmic adaptor subunit [Algoriphagus sediminis]MDN3204413.1 efflux RND transporter periplasmic adaptor subunit [Algoriphagus sediminis]
MKTIYQFYTLAFLFFLALGCQPKVENEVSMEEEHGHAEEVHLSLQQFQSLGLEVDSLQKRPMQGFVETNGQLTLPPQSQAAVTSIVGANISSVEVIEGNKVNKGQILAYMFHPNLIELQTTYLNQVNELEFAEQDYQRQERLYNESVSSGRDFQRVKANYLTLQGSVKGLEEQLKLLSISLDKVKAGEISGNVPLRSPIAGYVQHIGVRTGQYVAPEEVLFEIIQNDHIHAHFKVFESDIQKIKEGQTVQFIVESNPDIMHEATIFSVGKMFENDTKAVNIHAELENEDGSLLPGMYARGQILFDAETSFALPKDAVAMDGNRYYIFKAEQVEGNGEMEWNLTPMEVSIGVENSGWLEIKLHNPVSPDAQFATNNAYYLISELMKEEAGHDH